jgi:hypothetical protein
MNSDPTRRKILDLKTALKRRGHSCPVCSREMSLGYLAGLWLHLIWWPKGKKMPRVILDPQSKCLDFHHPMPSYLCEACRLAITQYKMPQNFGGIDSASFKNWNRASNECPYCGGRKVKGYLLPTAGYEVIPHLCWNERIGSFFKRGRKVTLTASLAYKGLLFTDKCKNCGLLFSIYDPNKIRRSNRIGMIFWAMLFVVMIILLFSIL